jgi:hypothetical protein
MKPVKYKVKSKVEIKGDNVRLISRTESNDSIRPLLTRPNRGRPTSSWLVGPYRRCHIKRWGARRTRYEVHHALQPPTNTTYRSRLGARPMGSFTTAILSPTLTPSLSPMASGSSSSSSGAGTPLSPLFASLSQITVL